MQHPFDHMIRCYGHSIMEEDRNHPTARPSAIFEAANGKFHEFMMRDRVISTNPGSTSYVFFRYLRQWEPEEILEATILETYRRFTEDVRQSSIAAMLLDYAYYWDQVPNGAYRVIIEIIGPNRNFDFNDRVNIEESVCELIFEIKRKDGQYYEVQPISPIV